MSDWARLIVASLVLPLIFCCLFSTLGGGITSVNLVGTTMYVLMVFIIGLLSTIYLNTGSYSESDEYRSLYLLEVDVGEAQLGIRRTALFIEACGTVDSIVVFEMEGEWTCLAEIWSDEESSETILAARVDFSLIYIVRKLGVKLIHNFSRRGDVLPEYVAVLG